MKINKENNNFSFKKKSTKTLGKSNIQTPFNSADNNDIGKASPFAKIMEQDQAEIEKKELFEEVNKLEILSDNLVSLPSLDSYMQYKNMIKKILNLALPETFKLNISEYSSLMLRQTDPKQFHIVETIDKELESLLLMIKEKHKDKIKMTASLIKIKGLVLDVIG